MTPLSYTEDSFSEKHQDFFGIPFRLSLSRRCCSRAEHTPFLRLWQYFHRRES